MVELATATITNPLDHNNQETALYRYQRDGFLLVPRVFKDNEVDVLREAFCRLNQRGQTLKANATIQTSRFIVSPLSDSNDELNAIHRVIWAGGVEPILDKFGQDQRLLAHAASILGTDTLVQIINQAHFKYPGDGVYFPWHQDSKHRRQGTEFFRDLDGQGSFVETITAVDPMTSKNGPLEVLIGSHLEGHLGTKLDNALPNLLNKYQRTIIRMNPGDVLLLSPFTIHRSLPNEGRQSRFAFLNGFTLPGANRRIYPGCGLGRSRRVSREST